MSIVNKILLEAKQRGTLYHYTGCANILNILMDDTLKAQPIQTRKKRIYGVSTTRDKHFQDTGRSVNGVSIRIELDGDKVTNNYKIVPFNDFSTFHVMGGNLPPAREKDKTESEELILGDLKNLRKYLIGISIFPDLEESERQSKKLPIIIDYLNDNKIPYYLDEIWEEAIDGLRNENNYDKEVARINA